LTLENKTVYLEFSEPIRNLFSLPEIGMISGYKGRDPRLDLANSAYHINGNDIVYIKNRWGKPMTFISDEDIIILKLKAVSVIEKFWQ